MNASHPHGYRFVATYLNALGGIARAWVPPPEQCESMILDRDLLAIDGDPFEYQWLDR